MNSKIKRKFNGNDPKEKNSFSESATDKISKTLVASNDDFKADIDNIFKSLHQSRVYFTVHTTQKLISEMFS